MINPNYLKKIAVFLITLIAFSSCEKSVYTGSKIKIELKTNSSENIVKQIDSDSYSCNEFDLKSQIAHSNSSAKIVYTLIAKEDINFNFEKIFKFQNNQFESIDFYIPGFWYKQNMRSPKKAPSFKSSKTWSFRDDRMSYPMVAAYDKSTKVGYYVDRVKLPTIDQASKERKGDEVLKTDIGSLGFSNQNGNLNLSALFPFHEYPKSYQSKLSLRDEWRAFYPLKKGESISFGWNVKKAKLTSFEKLVDNGIRYSYERMQPKPVKTSLSDNEIKTIITNYFYESMGKQKDLVGFSGLWFQTKTCETTNVLSIGFCGKIFANCYNLLNYAKDNNDSKARALAMKVINSYFTNGFTKTGLIRELLYNNYKEDRFTLRKQAEGIKNLIFILDFFKKEGKTYPKIEKKVSVLLAKFAKMQLEDGSLPRRFNQDWEITDHSKGSTQSIITPMILASHYFKNEEYLNVAKKAALFTEKELIDKADYFSSTLDANCEDKEAALIASSSFMQLSKVVKSEKEKKHYQELSKRAAYFTLSWYFLWDVPFDQNSLLYSLGLKTRGWGLVSTENNHIDVYAFDFPHVLNDLAKIYNDKMFSDFSKLIVSSLREQMLPYENHMQGVGKKGYMPEIIQQSEWDYGANGKGFLNSHMSVGWTVASIWEMLSPGRFDRFVK
jgi:hypothetical protein